MPAQHDRVRRVVPLCGLLAVLGAWLACAGPAAAQEPVDWRGNLECAPDAQVFEGLLYCTGDDETGAKTHVLVVDLRSADVAFEYILPVGASDGNSGVSECRDPNVPAWGGPAGGCYAPNDRGRYPTMRLDEAVERAREVRSSPSLAAVVDADYGAPNQTHGSEGLMVVRGERLDGAARCDDDFNAALRPWLGLGDGRDVEAGQIPVTISRLITDSAEVPAWVYTGIGGGPWLVRDGDVVSTGLSCRGEKTLDELEPVINCHDHDKTASPPRSEGYASGTCRTAPHTAAGLSRDARWLFLVLTSSNRDPDTIARYLRNDLGVWWALKFDGGGSTQLWYNAPEPKRLDPSGKKRALSNYLAVYDAPGEGVRLPLAAETAERVRHQVLLAGETARFTLAISNPGPLTWHPDDQVELRHRPWVPLSSSAEALPLSGAVPPGGSEEWTWEFETPGQGLSTRMERFQMYHRGEPFGQDVLVIAVGLPPEWEDQRDEIERKIQELVDEWIARGEAELDRLVDEINRWIQREINNFLNQLLLELQRFLDELCGSVCVTSGVILIGVLLIARPWGRNP